MQVSSFLNWRNRNEELAASWPPAPRQGFMEKHQVGQVVGGLVMSSMMWGLLAVGVYAVYSLVLGTK